MTNLELKFHFPGLKSHEIEVWVIECRWNAIYFPKIEKAQTDKKLKKEQTGQKSGFNPSKKIQH